MAGSSSIKTTIADLPDVILSNIIALITSVRSRNSAALVCRKWLLLERATRTALTLRGNALRDLFMVPSCFRSVTHLDLSLLSPWGHPLLSSGAPDSALSANILGHSFPDIESLTLYARNPSTLQLLAPKWRQLKHLKLVRWHQRPQLPYGSDLAPLFANSRCLVSLDLSSFYCWTDDIPAVFESHSSVTENLIRLNLLNPSFSEGFKGQELEEITSSCPNLIDFKVACTFDPRYIGFVGDETLISIVGNCKKLKILHLVDSSGLLNPRSDPNDEGFTNEDARITVPGLIEFFSGIPMIEELVLDVCKNVRESGPALEVLNSKCPRLKSLKLGQFHGICMAIESKLDGIALCQGLESLSIRNSADLTDLGLIAIARGCSRLAKFEVHGCKKITFKGMGTLACLLHKTLIDVKISCCKNLGAASSLKALEPIRKKIQRLHIDCVWDSVEQFENLDGVEYNFDLNKAGEGTSGCEFADDYDDLNCNKNKKCKYSYDLNCSDNGDVDDYKSWENLQYLSLWISVGELLTPLPMAGLKDCPVLNEIRIKVDGDCRYWSRPSERAFGLSCLVRYPNLTKMHLDCGETIGYAHTAPSGQMDLSLWERFYLLGIKELSLCELDYWPPQDRDVNQRSLSLPAAGLLQECVMLRKLFIHGTANEHFMKFLLRIPNLRDVQLREDYYPAPENDMSTEMRADSCSRFEDELNRRHISD
ncbi:hypothetical protein LguiA_022411 [Lonicera macranthoides]